MYRFVLFIFAITLFSCVKKGNYSCSCSTNNVLVQRDVYNDITKTKAQDKCDDLQADYRNADSTNQNSGITCILN